MKPITYKFASRLWKAQRVDVEAPFRKAAPYPGKFPTRVFLRVGTWKYIGKPSVNAWKTYTKLLQKCLNDYSVVEFDSKTVIYGVKRRAHRAMRPIYHEQLWNVYHPQSIANVTLNWMGYGVRTLGHRYVIGADGIKGVR